MRRDSLAVYAWQLVFILVAIWGLYTFTLASRDRFWKAEKAEMWRTQPLVKTQDGQTLTREQLIDLAIADFVQRQQQPQEIK